MTCLAPGLLPGGKAIRRKSYEITLMPAACANTSRRPAQAHPLAQHGAARPTDGQGIRAGSQAEIWIFLDAQGGVHAELPQDAPKSGRTGCLAAAGVEFATLHAGIRVSIAASLAHYFIGKRRAVGFVTGGPVYTVIPAERSERQESKVLETLAFVAAQGKLPLASLVDLQSPQMPLGSSALLITPSVEDDVLLAVELLQRRNLRPVVILLMAETFGGRPGSDELAEKLARRNVPVCRVFNNANLTETLSGFAESRSGDFNHFPVTASS